MLNKLCNVCNTSSYREVFSLKNGYMSDGTKLNFPLIKVECITCGTVRTKISFDWNTFYKNKYCPSRNVDTMVINANDSEITRSIFVYGWINSLLKKSGHDNFSSMIEVGCGQGYLLNRFNVKNKFGIEPGGDAFKIAKKIANVRNIFFEDINNKEKYDLVVSYCVIEHLQNPYDFLDKMFNILNDEGIMLIALPVQDKFNYDLFFMDHLYHFSHNTFAKLLNLNNFKILNYELGKDSYSNIGLYVCKKSKALNKENFQFEKNRNILNVNIILENINKILKNKNKIFYAFGYGEIAKTIIPYTNLDNRIKFYIDDTCTGDKVISSLKAKEQIKKEIQAVSILLLVNPKHDEIIKNLFSHMVNINFISIFYGIKIE